MATNGKYEDLPEAKRDALKRLSYIEGHLSGIRRMVEEDKYCVDVLKQTNCSSFRYSDPNGFVPEVQS